MSIWCIFIQTAACHDLQIVNINTQLTFPVMSTVNELQAPYYVMGEWWTLLYQYPLLFDSAFRLNETF